MAGTGEFMTDDLGLAVYLALKGYTYDTTVPSKLSVLWVFKYTDEQEEAFDEAVGDYTEFEAAVEPRRYMIKWREMRHEMFALIPRREHPQVRPASPAPQSI